MEEIIENIDIEVEESIYDKINGLTAEVNQMERMIEENIRLIAEGDDVEGRIYLKQHLENEVSKKKAEIIELAKADVMSGEITAEEYEQLIGEAYVAEVEE